MSPDSIINHNPPANMPLDLFLPWPHPSVPWKWPSRKAKNRSRLFIDLSSTCSISKTKGIPVTVENVHKPYHQYLLR